MNDLFASAKAPDPAQEPQLQLIEFLNHQLADTIDLRSQVRHACLNLHGPCTHELRLLFDGLAKDFGRFADLVGQRINALGGHAVATVRFAARESNLREYPSDAEDAREHLEALLSSCSRYEADTLRNMSAVRGLFDYESAELLRTIGSSVERHLWFLDAYLEGLVVGLHGSKLPPWTSTFVIRSMDDIALRY